MKYGFVVPVYNHGLALESVVKNIEVYNFPIIVVDDGNDEANKKAIEEVVKNHSLCVLVTRKKNGGKGKALADGVRKADELGLTHVLQIDSDGQHDAERVAHFVEVSKKNPDAIICAYPEYDESAPKHRVNGRAIANAWIHTVTLSKQIKDGMIGFRIYPVAAFKSSRSYNEIHTEIVKAYDKGRSYKIYVLDSSNEDMIVKDVFGPFDASEK
jgi:glycosyltransferase involved in cell wall biosynthesis